jgi:hypothetical protein
VYGVGAILAYIICGQMRMPAPMPLHVRVETYEKEVDMCDYSLEAYQSRPAEVGEKLTLERFPSGSMGFATGPGCTLAICVPADTQLRLEGFSETFKKTHRVGAVEEVVMTHLESGTYKDAVKFSNGTEILLQRLERGLTAVIVPSTVEPIDIAPKRAVREFA